MPENVLYLPQVKSESVELMREGVSGHVSREVRLDFALFLNDLQILIHERRLLLDEIENLSRSTLKVLRQERKDVLVRFYIRPSI